MVVTPEPAKLAEAKGDATPLAFTRFGSLLASLLNGLALCALIYALILWATGEVQQGFAALTAAVGMCVAGTTLGVLTEIALATAKRATRD